MPKNDEVRYIANITNASIIGISETKLDETILSSELKVDSYDLVRLDHLRWRGGVLVTLKVRLFIVTKTVFAVIPKVFLVIFFA